MTESDILVPAAVLAILRRDDSVRGVADRFGVTEAQVRSWVDLFVVAGVLAAAEYRNQSHPEPLMGTTLGATPTTNQPFAQSYRRAARYGVRPPSVPTTPGPQCDYPAE